MANQDIRYYARVKDVALWKIADALGIAESTFSKKLRHEFSDEMKERIKNIINELSK